MNYTDAHINLELYPVLHEHDVWKAMTWPLCIIAFLLKLIEWLEQVV